MAEIILTSENFAKEVINSDIPVLVDFFATWCGPCKMLSPIINEIAQEYEGKVKVCKTNTDEQAELCMKFGIEAIPTLILFEKGKAVRKTQGYQPKEKLIEFIGQ